MRVISKVSIAGNTLFLSRSQTLKQLNSVLSMGMKFLEWRFSQHSKKYEIYIFLTLMASQKTLSH